MKTTVDNAMTWAKFFGAGQNMVLMTRDRKTTKIGMRYAQRSRVQKPSRVASGARNGRHARRYVLKMPPDKEKKPVNYGEMPGQRHHRHRPGRPRFPQNGHGEDRVFVRLHQGYRGLAAVDRRWMEVPFDLAIRDGQQ